MTEDLDAVLDAVGPRLRARRRSRGLTLAEVSGTTGISESTLSRLESGGRRATLELLLPLARTYGVPLDDLVGAPETGDPRVHLRPVRRGGRTFVPLTRRPGGMQAYKMIIPPRRGTTEPDPQSHEGYEWLYVMAGRLRLVLGDRDLVLTPGEAAEFDTHVPHWMGATDDGTDPVELLILFGRQGGARTCGPAAPTTGERCGILDAVETVCSRCGTGTDGPTLTWAHERDERGAERWLCPDCARAHVRDIEARLSTDWW